MRTNIEKLPRAFSRGLMCLFAASVFGICALPVFGEWKISFDESSSKLFASSGDVSVEGVLSFKSDWRKWTFSNSRDGVAGRLALIDDKGDVQGYAVVPENSDTFRLLFYHRTAQSFEGVVSFDGRMKFEPDGFACRSVAAKGERVLPLGFGSPDSALNDSVFSPSKDELVRFSAASLSIKSAGVGAYDFKMSGDICESSESAFSFSILRDYFKSRWVPYYRPLDRARCPKTPTGWMSWNTYFDKATAADNLAEARIGKKFLQPFGCEIWSIESWQENSDTLPVGKFYNMNLETSKEKFPEGMKKLAADIRALGFRPGIWIAPFGTGNVEFYNAHKDWFLHDEKGNPIKSWNGFYTLDPSVPEALAHLKNIFETASRDWGYEFFKIDGMSGRSKSYCAHLYERPEIRARFKNPDVKNPFELCVKAFREGIGGDRIFLACQGHTSGPEAAFADAARTGADIVHANKPVMWKNVLTQARCTANQIFTHNISMIGDPDTVLVRDLPLEEARVTCTIVALPGQLTFFGDKLDGLAPERMKMLQQTLPPAFVRPMSLYPYFSMPPVWNLAVKSATLGSYNVAAFFNWGERDAEISASAEELGIDPSKKYIGFEFWTQTPLRQMKSPFKMDVPSRGVRLVVLTAETGAPQVIGSDRAVSQTGVEFKSLRWDAASKTLSGEVELVGDFPLSIFVNVPKGFALKATECEGAKCEVSPAANGAVKLVFAGRADAGKTSAKFDLKF